MGLLLGLTYTGDAGHDPDASEAPTFGTNLRLFFMLIRIGCNTGKARTGCGGAGHTSNPMAPETLLRLQAHTRCTREGL